LNVPVAVRWALVVAAITGFMGKIVRDDTSAALTFRDAEAELEPHCAVMVTLPRFRPVARPLTVMETTLLAEELQLSASVMACVLPSEKEPAAVNCCKVPKGIDAA
jgi:hypothetical protein